MGASSNLKTMSEPSTHSTQAEGFGMVEMKLPEAEKLLRWSPNSPEPHRSGEVWGSSMLVEQLRKIDHEPSCVDLLNLIQLKDFVTKDTTKEQPVEPLCELSLKKLLGELKEGMER